MLERQEDFSSGPKPRTIALFGKYSRTVGRDTTCAAKRSWSRLQNLNQLASAAALPSASNDNDAKTFLGAVDLHRRFSVRA